MGQSQGLALLTGAVCLRCASKPKATKLISNPPPSKDWWKLILEVNERNQHSCREKVDSLKRDVEQALLKIMKSAGEPLTYSKGHILLREGEVNSTLYLIVFGSCDVSIMLGAVKTAAGIEGGVSTVIAKLSSDDVFGEISFVLGSPASATVTVSSESANLRKIDMTQCAQLLRTAGFKPSELIKQIAFKLAEKLEISNNTKLSQLKLQKERHERKKTQLDLDTPHELSAKDLFKEDSETSIRLATFKCMFDKYDKNCSGSIFASECKLIFQDCNIAHDAMYLEEMMARYDSDASGTIEFEEFLRLIAGMSSEKSQVSKNAFNILDMFYHN
jgi:CRP-like cAMP-binding protein